MADRRITTGAICVYHRFVKTAVEALEGSGIPVAAVSTGFPAGLVPHDVKLKEIEASVRDGAKEIDIVITREHVLTGNWQALYDEMRDFRAGLRRCACQGDPRHRRPEDPAQRRARLAGLHDGRRRFHQDLDRQGRRERHAAGHAHHGAHDPRLS